MNFFRIRTLAFALFILTATPVSAADKFSSADNTSGAKHSITPIVIFDKGGFAPPSPKPSPKPSPRPTPTPSPSSQCDVSAPNLDCDLLGYWRFEEPVYFGRKHGVKDYSLTGHAATPVNAVHETSNGKLGRALVFDGNSEFVTVDYQELGTVPFGSASIWVKTTVSYHPDTYQVLIHSGSNTKTQLGINESGQFRFLMDADDTTYTLWSSSGHNDGKWHHIVATWGNSGMRFFVDGQQVGSHSGSVTRSATTEPWYIGTADAGQSGLFKGSLDEAAIWKRPLTVGEVQELYNSGSGRVISMGPEIDEFQPGKAIYQPTDLVSFDLAIDSLKSYSNAEIEVWVERELDEKIQVYGQPHHIVKGSQDIVINWPLLGNGLNNNVQGHLARVTVRDSFGQIIAEKEALFDVVSDWWKVMRLAAQGGSTFASPGSPSSVGRLSDSSIEKRVEGLRQWGFNTFEAYHYSPPWVLNPNGGMWADIDYPGRYISRDRMVKWGNALHSRGMKYLGYNEIAAIQGPSYLQLRSKANGSIDRKYYGDLGYFTPNLNFLSERWADENMVAINAFGFDGMLMDSAYNMGKTVVKYYNDNAGNPLPQAPSVGQYMHDWLAPAKATVRASKSSYAFVSQNAYPLVYPSLHVPLDDVYDSVFDEANKQDVWPYNDDVDMWSIEWDSNNTPSESYPQDYKRMATIMTSLVDIVGKPVLQWAFLTSGSRNDIAYIRPKMATYLAARLRVHDHHNFYEGLMNPDTQDEADSLQFAQYLRFQARYSYYLDHPDLELIQQPQATHFELSASKELFWTRTVYHRRVNGKDEFVINALNLPSDGQIQGQTEIPSAAEDVILKIRKTVGRFDVFSLDADDANLAPIEAKLLTQDATYRYFSVPSIRSWQVIVLKEK